MQSVSLGQYLVFKCGLNVIEFRLISNNVFTVILNLISQSINISGMMYLPVND